MKPPAVNNKNPFATKDQELLLRASLMDGAGAAGAWKEWKGAVDLEAELDSGSRRLLPLLYANLKRLEVKDELMGRLKGVYHKAWYRNQRLFSLAAGVLDYLRGKGVRTIVLKGIPMSMLYYRNNGVRPMHDIDVLVPASQALMAADLLKSAGWTLTGGEPPEALIMYRHSQEFAGESGIDLDLHWRLIEGPPTECSDFWDRAVPVKVQDVPSYALDATDMLFHIIVHGVRWNPEPAIRWIADAVTIMKSSGPQIDWRRIINHAKKYMVSLQLKEGLNYLYRNFQIFVPAAALDEINGLPASRFERFEYRLLIKNEDFGWLLGGGPVYLAEYLRTRKGGLPGAIPGFAGYLKFRMKKDNLRQLFFYLAARGIRMSKERILFFRKGVL